MQNYQTSSSSSINGLRWAWTLVAFCGLLLGYYFFRTYAAPRERQYQLDFGPAKWIEPSEPDSPIAYFRRKVHLTTLPEKAWLEIAATDNFALSVNGHTVASLNSVKTYETGIYDIKRRLKEGTNVIAVSVSRISYPGSAQLLVRGEITPSGANPISILSDESWRVSNRTGIIPASEEWNSAQVNDAIWPAAKLSALNGQSLSLRWVDTNPLLLQLPMTGYWIMADNVPPQAVFSTVIRADRPRQETWIQVASSGDLDLEVNGHIIAAAVTATAGTKRLPHLAASEPALAYPKSVKRAQQGDLAAKEKGSPIQPPELSAYDISHWIKPGQNEIVAAVRNERSPAAFLADGFMVNPDGTVSRFSTNSSWRIGEHPEEAETVISQHAVQLGKDGVAPWGYLTQELARPLDLSGFATVINSLLVIGLTASAVIALWLVASTLTSRWREESLANLMVRDALLHAPLAVGLLLLTLPNWDPRFPAGWSFQPLITVTAFAVLLLLRLVHLIPGREGAKAGKSAIERLKASKQWQTQQRRIKRYITDTLHLPGLFEIPFRDLLPYLVLVLIMFLGFGFRFHNLGYMSFDHDEMGLVSKSKGILNLGIPYIMFGDYIRWITTYEAVPYPLAFFGVLFGYSEWSMRLPACIMGTITIGVLGLIGRRLFDWRAGLLIALIYACLPLNIRWAQNSFYPTQCQLLATLTFWLFYEAIRTRPFNHKFLTSATVAFCFCYLSWEGTGFILPALFLGLIVTRWGEWWWLREFHIYRCLFFIGTLVVAQYCSRMLAGAPYLQVGSGLSNLTGPSLFFMANGYQPMFYIDKLLLSENHVFFTLMTVVGLGFCWKQPGFRYVFVLLATLFILHTNFLAALSPRYCYYFQPLVLIGGVGAAITLYDRLLALAAQNHDWKVSRLAAHVAGLALLALLFIQSNESFLKEYTLSSTGDTPQMMSRMGTYRYDYRGAADYVQSHFRSGDVILPGIPHVFDFYTGSPGDYSLDTLFSTKVTYFQLFDQPRFADKFAGLPVIRNLGELKEVVNRAGRTWIVFAPYAAVERLNSPSVIDYIHQNARAEFESYRAKVFLIHGAQPDTPIVQLAK